jgi:hypothetical protein
MFVSAIRLCRTTMTVSKRCAKLQQSCVEAGYFFPRLDTFSSSCSNFQFHWRAHIVVVSSDMLILGVHFSRPSSYICYCNCKPIRIVLKITSHTLVELTPGWIAKQLKRVRLLVGKPRVPNSWTTTNGLYTSIHTAASPDENTPAEAREDLFLFKDEVPPLTEALLHWHHNANWRDASELTPNRRILPDIAAVWYTTLGNYYLYQVLSTFCIQCDFFARSYILDTKLWQV